MRLSLASRGRQGGQSSVEYIIVVTFAVLVLIQATADEEENPVKQVATAIKKAWKGFSYASSFSTNFTAP